MPRFKQLFVQAAGHRVMGMALERMAFCLRKRAEHEADVYFPSLSSRTIVYKGMLTTGQLEDFFPDLVDERYTSALALVHSRFSTNTFPSWPLAHPYRLIAHNGEINTVKGNRNWMRAREAQLASDLIPGDLTRLFPICTDGGSDSASFDEVLELLHLGGRSLPHAVLMMIPEAWENHTEMDPARRAFYEFHATLIEPWDGPADVCFTDGTVIGAVLDRNGLRPGRYWVTDDGLVVARLRGRRARHRPSDDRAQGPPAARAACSSSTPSSTASSRTTRSRPSSPRQDPYDEWLHAGVMHLDSLPEREHIVHTHRVGRCAASRPSATPRRSCASSSRRWRKTGAEPIGSMGTDTPIAVLSERPRLLFDYFAQLFAQVTNPPLDAIREELVTSLSSHIGPEGNLLTATPGALPPARAAVPGDRQRRARQDPPHQQGRRPARLRRGQGLGPLRRRRRGSGAARAARGDLRRGVGAHRRRQALHRAVRPRLRRRPRADPVAAAHLRGAPPPGAPEEAHEGRASSSRPATSARCTTSRCSSATARPRSTPTSRWSPSRTSSAAASSRASRRRRPSATSSRRSARACSRS